MKPKPALIPRWWGLGGTSGPFEKIAVSTKFSVQFHSSLLITFKWYTYNIKHFARLIVIKQPLERSPRTREIGRFDSLCCSNRLQLHCQTLGNRCECPGSEMNIKTDAPCHSRSAEHRPKFAALHRQC